MYGVHSLGPSLLQYCGNSFAGPRQHSAPRALLPNGQRQGIAVVQKALWVRLGPLGRRLSCSSVKLHHTILFLTYYHYQDGLPKESNGQGGEDDG